MGRVFGVDGNRCRRGKCKLPDYCTAREAESATRRNVCSAAKAGEHERWRRSTSLDRDCVQCPGSRQGIAGSWMSARSS